MQTKIDNLLLEIQKEIKRIKNEYHLFTKGHSNLKSVEIPGEEEADPPISELVETNEEKVSIPF